MSSETEPLPGGGTDEQKPTLEGGDSTHDVLGDIEMGVVDHSRDIDPSEFKNGDDTPAFYGNINFVGKDTGALPPFIVTKFQTKPEELKKDASRMAKYMTNNWGLQPPRVLISVTGGAQAFKMRPRLERVFARGLVRSAQNTNAWIVTGGLDSGVMDYVGRAVRINEANVPTIAVASFRMVTHHEQFLGVRGGEPVQYKKLVPNTGNSAALETNHTHFIFVDKGSAGWGVEIPFRTEMEDQFLNEKVPVVLIVVQGGPGTFQTVLNGVKKGFPIILVEGSGGAADAICVAWRNRKFLSKKVGFPAVDTSILEKYPNQRNLIEEVLNEDDTKGNLTLFNVSDANAEFDTVLLKALLENKARDLHFKDKLLLAVEWKRVDILQELFDQTSVEEDTSDTGAILQALDSAFQKALDLDYPDLYTVLLKNGARIANVNLNELYSIPEVRARLKLLGTTREKLSSAGLGEEAAMAALLPGVSVGRSKLTPLAISVLSRLPALQEYLDYARATPGEVNFCDLMIWAALAERTDLCKAIWETASYPIHSALVVSYIYRFLAEVLPDKASKLNEDADLFEDFAIGVLDNFQRYASARKALELNWKIIGSTALRIGVAASCKRFVSHRYPQKVLDQQFFSDENGKMKAKTPHKHIILMIFFPIILFFKELGPFHNPYRVKVRPDGSDPGFLAPLNFFHLPVVKLWTNTLFYMLFLILLSWLASEPIEHDLSFIEYFLGVWIAALLIDEVFQFLEDPAQHFEPTSNKLDFSILVAFIAYYILRFISAGSDDEGIRDACVDILIPTVVCCYLRLMQVFSINYYLGPLLIMIFKMMKDIIRFFSLFLLFFAGFQISFILITQQAAYHGEADSDAWEKSYPDGTMGLAYWAFIGEFGDSFDVLQKSDLGLLMMGLYLILGQILLQNLLIAMMADTYSEIRDNSDQEWKFSRYLLVHEYKTANLVPPPLNLLELVFQAINKFFTFFTEEEPEPAPIPEDENFVKAMSELRAAFVDESNKKSREEVSHQVSMLGEMLDSIIQDRAEDKEQLIGIDEKTSAVLEQLKAMRAQ